jgi:ribosomal protein S18 acetylase RimI-like enzyme
MKDMYQIVIRKARIGDMAQVLPLFKGILQYHQDLDSIYASTSRIMIGADKRFEKLVRKRKSIIAVAEVNNKIVGFFIGDIRKTKTRKDNLLGFISDGYVDKKYRNKGVGRELLNWLINWFSSKGIKRIELMVDSSNKLGIKAWQSYGFKEYQKKMQKSIK